MFRFARLVTCLLSVTFVVGCGRSHLPDVVPVSGSVTLDGKPLKAGRIVFFPDSGHQALGEVKGGRYELRAFGEGKGAVPGTYRVTVTAVDVLRGTPREVKAPEGTPPEVVREMMMESTQEQLRWIAPQRYSNRSTSPLTAEVKPGQDNDIDFALESK